MSQTSVPLSTVRTPFVCVVNPGGDKPAPWPYRSTLRAQIIGDVHPIIRRIIVQAAKDWLETGTRKAISVVEVTDGISDVRISVGSGGMSRCAVGVHAKSIANDQPTAVLAMNTWAKDGGVWDHERIQGACRHMWGHIFGLPHGMAALESSYDRPRVKELCAEIGVDPQQMTNLRGCGQLNSRESVMHFDRPGYILYSGETDPYTCLSTTIDPQSHALLLKLYPPAPEVTCTIVSVTEMDGFVGDRWVNQRVFERRRETSYFDRPIYGISKFDLGTHASYVAEVGVKRADNNGYTLAIGSYERDAHIFDIKGNFMSFLPDDKRFQTGLVESPSFRSGDWNNPSPGEQWSRRIDFPVEYTTAPQVVCFIYRFRMPSNNWIRMNAFADAIDRKGFTIHLNSWADTRPFNISVCWVAHDSEDPTVRSGRFMPPEHPSPWVRYDADYLRYTCPLVAAPRYGFVGFSHVNVKGGVNARATVDMTQKDDQGVRVEISSWSDENKWHSMGAAYIVVL